MHAPKGEVTLFEGLGDAAAAAFFMFFVFVAGVVGVVTWAIVNFKRRRRWASEVLLVTIAAPLLLITPLVWKGQVDGRESYPTRYKAYEAELADYRKDCLTAVLACWLEPQPPDHPIVRVPLHIALLGVGAVSLVAGLRIKADDVPGQIGNQMIYSINFHQGRRRVAGGKIPTLPDNVSRGLIECHRATAWCWRR